MAGILVENIINVMKASIVLPTWGVVRMWPDLLSVSNGHKHVHVSILVSS